jgi:hypothetical protein
MLFIFTDNNIFLFFCQYISRPFQNRMAYNGLGWRRFASPYKGLRRKTRAGKMWWSKTPQRAESPTGVLRNPSRRKAAKR